MDSFKRQGPTLDSAFSSQCFVESFNVGNSSFHAAKHLGHSLAYLIMNSRRFIIILAAVLINWTLLAESKRPNVLFIAVDDMRADLGCYGHPEVLSPNLDRLADTSLRFERAYCQQAVCNPSRASLLTGLRPETLGITDLPTHFRKPFPNIVTLPQLFKNNGYHAENIGKIFHNWRQDDFKGDPVSWSVPARMQYARHGDDVAKVSGVVPPDLLNVPRGEMRDVPDDAYFDGRIANDAVQALQRLKDEPFFLAVGFWKPHLPFNAPKKYWDLYDRNDIQIPPDALPPENVPNLAMHDSREMLRGFSNGVTRQQVKALRHGYYAAISYVDAQIGKVLDELDRLDLRKNTIIVFWSDHGFHLSEHGLWAKTSNFELDARVPMMISAPGFRDGKQTTQSLVELLDLYPTLVDLCQLPAPAHRLEGVSLKPILQHAEASVKPAAFTQHPRPAYPPTGTDPRAMGYSMRTDRWRYTEWRTYDTGQVLARELYDHEQDSGERRNVVSEREHRELVNQLERELEEAYPVKDTLWREQSDQSDRSDQSPKPNIVLILADDLGYGDLGCYGNKTHRTPNIDRLAKEGLRFTDFHSNGSMCTPTRAALLTGRYQQRLGTKFEGPLSGKADYETGLPLSAITMAESLKKAGYVTGMFGKWHLGYQVPFLPTRQGFDTFVGLTSGDGDHHTHVDRSGRPDWWSQENRINESGYTADLLTDHAIQFMETQKDKPFFLYLPHLAIHFPWQGPDDPPHREVGTDYWNDKWGLIPDRSNVAPHIKAMVESLDANVGRLMATLEQLELDERTIVFFLSDNGGYRFYGNTHQNISSNGRLRGQKGTLWEGGHRVPSIARWKGHIKPGQTDETVMGFDLFPTLLSLATSSTHTQELPLDGVDLSNLLFQQEPLPHRELFWRDGNEFAMRSGPWKLLHLGNQQFHLFDLYHDPEETHDVASLRADQVKRMIRRFRTWETEMGL